MDGQLPGHQGAGEIAEGEAMNLDIHEEFHRLVLRCRWMRWMNRQNRECRKGLNKYRGRRIDEYLVLSARLTAWKPVYEERHPPQMLLATES
jgi:hypothetical protein